MSTQTEYLGLHQWESTDSFLREDFNQDNAKIDQAVGKVQEQAGRTAEGLERMSYNVYNLLLQNYYEDKYTGYKKALIFDGFLDRSRVAEVSGAALICAGMMCVTAQGQGDMTIPGQDYYMIRDCDNSVTAEGGGRITGVEIYVKNASGAEKEIGAALASSDGQTRTAFLTIPEGEQSAQFTLDEPLDVHAGEKVTVSFTGFSGSMAIQASETSKNYPAMTVLCTAVSGSTGSMTSVAEEGGGSLHLWARYSGGSLQTSALLDSAEQTMELVESGDALTLDGLPCTEAYFRLEAGEYSGTRAVRLTLSREEGTDTAGVYDYGFILL